MNEVSHLNNKNHIKLLKIPNVQERFTEVQNREETVRLLKYFLRKGYRWVVREEQSPILLLFSLKPKKYLKLQCWGYTNENAEGALMAEVIKNIDITEILWSNRQPTNLEQFIKDNEVQDK